MHQIRLQDYDSRSDCRLLCGRHCTALQRRHHGPLPLHYHYREEWQYRKVLRTFLWPARLWRQWNKFGAYFKRLSDLSVLTHWYPSRNPASCTKNMDRKGYKGGNKHAEWTWNDQIKFYTAVFLSRYFPFFYHGSVSAMGLASALPGEEFTSWDGNFM